jgi:hypothetical protein
MTDNRGYKFHHQFHHQQIQLINQMTKKQLVPLKPNKKNFVALKNLHVVDNLIKYIQLTLLNIDVKK